MSEKCPVCEHEVDEGAIKCRNCGFADELSIARVSRGAWTNAEDLNYWLETVVKPYRVKWEAEKQIAEMQAKLEMSQKNEMRLSNELEQMRAKGTSLGKWVCSVCGYVHTGGSPPHYCPQCKAPPSKYKEQTASMYDNTNSVHIARDISIGEWVCSVCGYVHTGVNAPDSCPQCKAPSSKFKAALLARLEEAEKREAELRVELEEAKRQKTEKQGGGVPALLARLEEAEKRKADLLDKQTRIK